MDAHRCEAVLRPYLADLLARLDADQLEAYAERAAIIEFDAGQPRVLAECLALLSVLKRWPALLSPLVVLEFDLGGEVGWLLALDPVHGRRHLAAMGGREIAWHVPSDALQRHFGGAARLVRPG